MAGEGDPAQIVLTGDILRNKPATKQTVVLLSDDSGLMSAGLAASHERKARALDGFATAKDDGLVAAGNALMEIGERYAAIDRQGAKALQRLFPDTAPGADGGQ